MSTSETSRTIWKSPVQGIDCNPTTKQQNLATLDLSIGQKTSDPSNSSTAYIVEIPRLRSQLHDLSERSREDVFVLLSLAGNNLKLRRGGEQLATMLVSMFHRQAFHVLATDTDAPSSLSASPDTTSSKKAPTVLLEELDISCTGALEDFPAWTMVFRTMTVLPITSLQRLCANDESMQVAIYGPLLESLASSFTHLTHVALRRCLLNRAAMEAFARGIVSARGGVSSLEFLDISENELDSAALTALATALHSSEGHRNRIRVLNLSHNNVSTTPATAPSDDTYCRKGLLSLALLVLHAPMLMEVSLKGNGLGSAHPPRWPAGGDHGGTSEVCEAARRSIATRGGGGKPPIIDVTENEFNPHTLESLHRCSGFTAVVL